NMQSDGTDGVQANGYTAYRLRRDADVQLRDDGALTLRVSRYRLGLDDVSAGRRAAVLRLAAEWTTDQGINELVTALEGESRILQVQVLVRGLLAHSWLDRRLHDKDGRPVLDILPHGLGANSLPRQATHAPDATYRLSRFALLRSDGDRLVAETPLATVAVAVVDPAVTAALTVASRHAGLSRIDLADTCGCDDALAGRLLDELLTAGILVNSADADSETREARLASWSPVELALHHRAR